MSKLNTNIWRDFYHDKIKISMGKSYHIWRSKIFLLFYTTTSYNHYISRHINDVTLIRKTIWFSKWNTKICWELFHCHSGKSMGKTCHTLTLFIYDSQEANILLVLFIPSKLTLENQCFYLHRVIELCTLRILVFYTERGKSIELLETHFDTLCAKNVDTNHQR